MVTRISHNEQETLDLARRFAKLLKTSDIIFLQGDLGAGKTVFVKGVAKAFNIDPNDVNSPTFVLMNVYHGKLPLYHFDLYRLNKKEELRSVHFDEYLYGKGITLIEWPSQIQEFSPKEYWLVNIEHKNENERRICISYPSNPQRRILV